MSIETVEFVLPVYWASYLVNGDDSGITEEERAEIDSFIDGAEVGAIVKDGALVSAKRVAGCVEVSEESYFSWWNDAFTGLGGDVAAFTFAVQN
jgi:hypothetical protein